MFLQAEPAIDNSARLFRIGLADNAGPFTATYFAVGTDGTAGTLSISPTAYRFDGLDAAANGVTDVIPSLVTLGINQPAGLRTGSFSTGDASALVMQSAPLLVLAGAPGSSRAGYLQLAVP